MISGRVFRKSTETDMTEGSIFRHLVVFAVPLLLGNLFQQLYNTVDTWVVGNYVGKVSFSAVGTLNPVTNMLIGFFSGFAGGAGVIISKYFGARRPDKVSEAVHTFVTATLILCVLMTAAGILMVPLVLKILNSPAEVAEQQRIYLTIYGAGISGLLIYNMGSAVLRAVGNSTLPFLFLLSSTVMNIFLDLLFVLQFSMGTAGVAYATVISQAVSAVLVMIVLLRSTSSVKVAPSLLKLNFSILLEEVRVGFPTAVQLSLTAFSNIFVQRYVNCFGTDVMGGWTAYNKIDQLFFLPMQSIALSTTTFTGQNLGAGNISRARRGVLTALVMALVSTLSLVLPVMIHAPRLVTFFIDAGEKAVISYGTLFLRLNGLFFLAACVNQVLGAALRGCGKSAEPMIAMLFSFVLFRQVYLFVVTRYIANTPQSVGISYPVGWMVCSAVIGLFYLFTFPKENVKGH